IFFRKNYREDFNHLGFLSSAIMLLAEGMISTSSVRKTGIDWPDVYIYLHEVGTYFNSVQDYTDMLGTDFRYMDSVLKSSQGENTFSLTQILFRPKSIGEITLRDRNPFSHPLINPNYLKHPDDVQALVEGIKFSLKLVENTTTFQRLNARHPPDIAFGCEEYEFRSDAYWECYIRTFSFTLYHPTGTCRMGKGPEDSGAVVDSKLRVLHTRGLRVADASIMPVIINGNTNAPTIMIGEKTADLIREYWSEQYLICPQAFDHIFNLKFTQDKCFYTKLT
ncbi:unnamed protein product, partial [Allacma fusca]